MSAGRPLVQGMRVALAAEVRTDPRGARRADPARRAGLRRRRRPGDLAGDLQRIPAAEQGKGYQARELGVPVVSDAKFMDSVATVASGTGVEEFIDATLAGEQFALF